MKKTWKYRAGALFLCLCLGTAPVLTGCGKEKTGERETGQETALGADKTLLKVEKEKMTVKEGMIYWMMLQERYEGKFGKQVWDLKIEDGKTLKEEAVDQLLEEMVQVHILCDKAASEEITVDSEDELSLKSAVENYYASMDSRIKDSYQMTYEDVYQVYYQCLLAETVFEISTNNVSTTIQDEEARRCRVLSLYLPSSSPDGGDEVYEQMKKLRKEAAAIEDVEELKLFVQGNTKDRLPEQTLGEDSKGLDAAFQEAALSLKSGELSSIITGADGYYLIYCINETDDEATHSRKTEIILEKQREAFLSVYQQWKEEYEVKEYDDVVREFIAELS